ncbi:MAG: efflux RND transporter periplasmic adaptor subunit [Ectothiorhodospiraceae bacterium]|jgi:HlyD family secretion protein
MTQRLRRFAIPLALILAVGAAIWYWTRPEPVSVRVAEVQRGVVESTVSNTRAGTVMAHRRSKIAPATSGQVVALPIKEGMRVEKGELLLELWNQDIRAQLDVAQARSRAAAAKADEACVRADAARRDAQRLIRLHNQGSVSEESADRAVSERDAAVAACRASRAEAQVADSNVEVADAALARTRLTAPFPGVVAEVNAELGEIVTPSPPGIATPAAVDLIDATSLYVSAPIDEVDAPAVQVGLPARVTLDAFPGRNFAGQVSRIAPYVLDLEKQARTVEVEVSLNDVPENTRLLPGYSADAEIIIDTARDVLRIPSEAVMEGGRVMLLDAEGRIAERNIETGLRNWQYTAVTSGLEAGDRVILTPGAEGVVPGAAARVDEGSAP